MSEDIHKQKWQVQDDMKYRSNPLQALVESFCKNPKDMSEDKYDAWTYGIIVGWDDASFKDLSEKHGWDKRIFERNKELHQNYIKCWNLFMENNSI